MQRFKVRERGNAPEAGAGKEPEVPCIERLEPYEGKLSRTVLRREWAEQSTLTLSTK
jgi:hypothetical protein